MAEHFVPAPAGDLLEAGVDDRNLPVGDPGDAAGHRTGRKATEKKRSCNSFRAASARRRSVMSVQIAARWARPRMLTTSLAAWRIEPSQ